MEKCFTLTSGPGKRVLFSMCCKRVCYYSLGKHRCSVCHGEVDTKDCEKKDIIYNEAKSKYADYSFFEDQKFSYEAGVRIIETIEDWAKTGEDIEKYIKLIRQYPYLVAENALCKLAKKMEKKEDIFNLYDYLRTMLERG